MDKASGNLVQKTLGEGLGLPAEGYAIFKDYVSRLEYIRSCRELIGKGLFVLLGGYQCHVFLDWRFVDGDQWKAVYETLNGAGVESMQARFDEMFAVKEEVKSETVEDSEKKATKKRTVRKPGQKSASNKTAKTPVKKPAGKRKTVTRVKSG